MKTLFSPGFSLIEMAIVLIIIGFLVGGLLTPLSAQRDRQQIKRTLKTLEEVKEALLGFAVIHKRLPCSDRNGDGQESKNTTDCESNGEGYLPWKDLGVGRYDGWGKHFRYRTEADFNEIPNISKSILTSGLRLKNRHDNNLTSASAGSDSRVAAIIFSCGKNGRPDPTKLFPETIGTTNTNDADDKRNTDALCTNPRNSGTQNKIYIDGEFVSPRERKILELEPEKEFDDILIWLSRNTLMSRLITAKRWP